MKQFISKYIHLYIFVAIQFALATATILAFVPASFHLYSFIGLGLLLGIPFVLFRKWNIRSFFLLTSTYLAFIFSFNPSQWDSVFSSSNPFLIDFSLTRNLTLLLTMNKELLFLLVLFLFIYIKEGFSITKWQIICLFISTLCLGCMMLLPLWADIFLYFLSYFLILVLFYVLDQIMEKAEKVYEKIVLWSLISVFFLRGIYVMWSILRAYPL